MSKTSQREQSKRHRTVAIRTAAYKSVLGEPHKPIVFRNKKERVTYDKFKRICTEHIAAQQPTIGLIREPAISDN